MMILMLCQVTLGGCELACTIEGTYAVTYVWPSGVAAFTDSPNCIGHFLKRVLKITEWVTFLEFLLQHMT